MHKKRVYGALRKWRLDEVYRENMQAAAGNKKEKKARSKSSSPNPNCAWKREEKTWRRDIKNIFHRTLYRRGCDSIIVLLVQFILAHYVFECADTSENRRSRVVKIHSQLCKDAEIDHLSRFWGGRAWCWRVNLSFELVGIPKGMLTQQHVPTSKRHSSHSSHSTHFRRAGNYHMTRVQLQLLPFHCFQTGTNTIFGTSMIGHGLGSTRESFTMLKVILSCGRRSLIRATDEVVIQRAGDFSIQCTWKAYLTWSLHHPAKHTGCLASCYIKTPQTRRSKAQNIFMTAERCKTSWNRGRGKSL